MRVLLLFTLTAALTGSACTIYFGTDGTSSPEPPAHGSGNPPDFDAGGSGGSGTSGDSDGGIDCVDAGGWSVDGALAVDGGYAPGHDGGPQAVDAGAAAR